MLRSLPLLLLLAAGPAGAEIYKWTDANGRVHFGDSATAAREGAKAESVAPAPGTKPGAASGSAGSPSSGAGGDARALRERERRVLEALQQDRAERDRSAQEQAAARQQREQECRRLRQELASMEGRPVYLTDEKGERQFLDDTQRRDYVDKANALLAEHCQ